MKPLSKPMKRVLRNLMRGDKAFASITGRSAMGGMGSVMLALRTRGLIDGHDQLTEQGRKVCRTMQL